MTHVMKPALILLAVAAVVTVLISAVHASTLAPIENQLRKTREDAMRAVLPRADAFREVQTELTGNITGVYEGLAKGPDGEREGWVIALAPAGYSGTINLMVGISSTQERLTGIRILSHSETPGLGALAATEKFYAKFAGRSLSPLSVVRGARAADPGEDEIDAITSATITTRSSKRSR